MQIEKNDTLKLTNFDKILASLAGGSYVMWLGGSIARMIVGFDIFQPGTILLKGYDEPLNRLLSQLFAVLAPYVDFPFIIVFLASLYFLARYAKQMKKYGWLFMSLMLIILAGVPQFFLMYLDYNLVYAAMKEGVRFEDPDIQQYFIGRFAKYGFLEPMVLMAGMSIPFLFAFKPLHKPNLVEKNED